jgi:hypothetical protein
VQRGPADTIGEPMLLMPTYPHSPALRSFMLPVGSGHVLHLQEWAQAADLAAFRRGWEQASSSMPASSAHRGPEHDAMVRLETAEAA